MQAPFPYFGGKSQIAKMVWEYLGDVSLYVEPFCGSIGVLLNRPQHHKNHGRMEIINDADGFIVNAWRAIQADPDAVAYYADWPITEIDLHARNRWLHTEGIQIVENNLIANLLDDPGWYDAKIAGWWIWGQSAWLGRGWAWGRRGNYPRPHLSNRMGIHRWSVHQSRDGIYEYMRQLADRLRYVAICYGDWSRVVTRGVLDGGNPGPVGILLDPPYSFCTGRDLDLYRIEDHDVAADVREWCIQNGENPRYRIVLCGYDNEHDMPASWQKIIYTGARSYASSESAACGDGNTENRRRECLWISPHCNRSSIQRQLFDVLQ